MLKGLKRWLTGSPIVIYHEFHKPPYGGGNQFLLALKNEFEKMGLDVGLNRVGPATSAVLFNSYNFEYEKLRKIDRSRLKLIHRVDGPIDVYRGTSDGVDQKIWRMNNELADATIFQSRYSLEKHLELGLEFKNPVVIPNAVNPDIFCPASEAARPPAPGPCQKVRVVASAWSDNPRKGGPVYEWLDQNLDRSRFEFTFVGRIKNELKNSRTLEAVPSEKLAEILRAQHIYITASQQDTCSNALIEALSCALPAVYLDSGGHPELVGEGGLGFTRQEEIPRLLEEIAQQYEVFRSRICAPKMEDVARRYFRVLTGA